MESQDSTTTAAVTGVGFVTAFVDDFPTALMFYTEVLGLRDQQPMGPNACYFVFPNDTGMYLVGGHERHAPVEKSVRTTFALEVESALTLFENLKAAGILPLQDEPMQMNDDVFWFQVHDPAGNRIEIVGGR